MQYNLLDIGLFPSTRYQGSKAKLTNWIWENLRDLEFHSVLDAFGGTGSVSYLFKQNGKEVTYNDILRSNAIMAKGLIENNSVRLDTEDIRWIMNRNPKISYPSFIFDNFRDIYYTDEENIWLDIVSTNIKATENEYKRCLAAFALFQSCIIKRPFNLFHRKNLYLRFNNVERSFGNKKTWDTPFPIHFEKFADEANNAVIDTGVQCRVLNSDVFAIEGDFDLVYIDPPYMPLNGVGIDYHHFYHFLEGLARYEDWGSLIDYKSKHKRIKTIHNDWTDKGIISKCFERLFERFKKSVIVVSYRSDGIPSVSELEKTLGKYKTNIREVMRQDYKYVLSKRESQEVLLVGI